MKILELGCKRPAVSSEKLCMGVRDSRCYPKTFCLGVRDLRHKSKFLLPKELSDRSRDRLRIGYPLANWHWVLVSQQRLGIWVSLVLPVTIATLGIDMCEGVDE